MKNKKKKIENTKKNRAVKYTVVSCLVFIFRSNKINYTLDFSHLQIATLYLSNDTEGLNLLSLVRYIK